MTDEHGSGFLRRLLERLLTAALITLVVIGVFYGFNAWWVEREMGATEERMASLRGNFGPDSGLEITEHRQRQEENRLVFLGQLANNGDQSWQTITVKVDLFDAEDTFLDQCETYIRGHLAAGGTTYFKVDCSRCAPSAITEFARYEINVTDANRM